MERVHIIFKNGASAFFEYPDKEAALEVIRALHEELGSHGLRGDAKAGQYIDFTEVIFMEILKDL